MKQRARIYYTESQKALMWERWRAGDNLHQIANLFDRHHISVQGILVRTGGLKCPVNRSIVRRTREGSRLIRNCDRGPHSGVWHASIALFGGWLEPGPG